MNARPQDAEIQGFFCPIQPAGLLAKRLGSGKCIYTDAGLEKRCSKCGAYWPMDPEFWFPSKTEDGLFNWCRACYIGQRWPERGAPERSISSPVFTELLLALAPSHRREVSA
jgi:hypothetical protein